MSPVEGRVPDILGLLVLVVCERMKLAYPCVVFLDERLAECVQSEFHAPIGQQSFGPRLQRALADVPISAICAVNPPMNPKVSWEVVDTPDPRPLLVLVEKKPEKPRKQEPSVSLHRMNGLDLKGRP